MMNLRDVLTKFEAGKPLSLAQMARDFEVEQSALEGMIDFWVRKGKLRESAYTNCADCGISHACPVGMALPKRYELVVGTPVAEAACPHCTPKN
jgi:hypothetical protein